MDDGRVYELIDGDDEREVLAILDKISILAGLNSDQLSRLFDLLHLVQYKTGEHIFEQGDQPSYIYIVKTGRVKLVIWEDDTPLELVVFEEGRCFGEASVIGIQPHKGTAIAEADTELIVLSRPNLMSIYETDKELFGILILNIAREACRRLYASGDILLHYMLEKR